MNLEPTTEQTTEQVLILKARAGDNAACNELLSKYKEHLYQYAMRALGDHAKADDASQEAMIWAWQNIKSAPPEPERFKFWILAACKNNNYKIIHARAKEDDAWNIQHILERGSVGFEWTSTSNPFPDEQPHPVSEIHQYLVLLPHKQRKCLEMRLEGFSVKEISESMHIQYNAVKVNLYKARRRIKKLRKGSQKVSISPPNIHNI